MRNVRKQKNHIIKIYSGEPHGKGSKEGKKVVENSNFFPESFFILGDVPYICNVNQLNKNNYEKGNDSRTKGKKGSG
jgi:hypothetical protein